MLLPAEGVVALLSDNRQGKAPGAGTPRVRRPFPAGDTLPGFPGAHKSRAKTPRAGGGLRNCPNLLYGVIYTTEKRHILYQSGVLKRALRSRWKDERGRIIERDYLHDTVEMYDPSGRRHLGDFDPWDGRQVGPADPSRHVEP